MDSKNLSSPALEPDLIVDGEKVVYMSDAEQERSVVEAFECLVCFLRGGAL